MSKHLPCPFCGGEVDAEGWLNTDGERGPECETCGATAPSIKRWNTRLQVPPQTTLVACTGDFDRDLAAVNAIRNGIHVSESNRVLLSFIDNLWREYSRASNAQPPAVTLFRTKCVGGEVYRDKYKMLTVDVPMDWEVTIGEEWEIRRVPATKDGPCTDCGLRKDEHDDPSEHRSAHEKPAVWTDEMVEANNRAAAELQKKIRPGRQIDSWDANGSPVEIPEDRWIKHGDETFEQAKAAGEKEAGNE